MRPPTENDLFERLADLTDPVPPSPPGLTATIRRRAVRQRHRRAAGVAVAVILAVTGSIGWLSRTPAPDRPQPLAASPSSTGVLLGWPTRGALAATVTAAEVTSAWDTVGTTHQQVHVLYASRLGTAMLVVAEGRDQAGSGRIAALVTQQSTVDPQALRPTADIASPATPGSSYLLVTVERANHSVPGTLIALADPTARPAELRRPINSHVFSSKPVDPAIGVATIPITPGSGWSIVPSGGSMSDPLPVTEQSSGTIAAAQPISVHFFR